MTSVPSISRLRMSAWAPVSFMGAPGERSGSMFGPDAKNPPHLRRARRTDASEPYAYVITTRRSAVRYMRWRVSPRSARDSSQFVPTGHDEELAVAPADGRTRPPTEDLLHREAGRGERCAHFVLGAEPQRRRAVELGTVVEAVADRVADDVARD